MTVLDELRSDDLPNDTDLVVSGPWSLSGAVPRVLSDAAIHGARGLRYASTGSYGRVQYSLGGSLSVVRVISHYFELDTFASASYYPAGGLDSGSTSLVDWRVNLTRTVSIRNGGVAVGTSTATLVEGTVYRYEWRLDPVADLQELRIFEGESATPYLTLSGTFTASTVVNFSFGSLTAASGGAVTFDTIKIADDWVGPDEIIPSPTPTMKLVVFRFDGTAWV